MKIVVTEVQEHWQKEFFYTHLPDDELQVIDYEITAENASEFEQAEVLSVFIRSSVDSAVLDKLPNLKYITARSTGFDHIDTAYAQKKGILTSNVPFYGENTVAEHAMALILSLSRKLLPSFKRIEEGKFDFNGLRGWDLKGKQLGVVGGGHIGMHVARMAKGFEMDVVVFDLAQDAELAKKIGFRYMDLDEVLKTSHVISLHLPLNEKTEHFINDEKFEMMRDGVYIINTARGGLIDTDSLIKYVQNGKVAGAGLDVLEEEDLMKEEIQLLSDDQYKDKIQTLLENHILMEMENVIVTPHIAFNSHEAVERILQTSVENIHSFKKQNPQNVV